MKMKTTKMEFEGIPVNVIIRSVKYSRIEFKREGLRLILPKNISADKVLKENKAAIIKKYSFLQQQVKKATLLSISNRSEKAFSELVVSHVEKYCLKLQTDPVMVKFRKMRRRWGTCHSNGRIILNQYLQFLPEQLIAYVIFHEIAHTIIRQHNRQFKSIIKKEFPHYRDLDNQLNLYALRVFD